MKFIELSHELAPEMPVWPGDPETKLTEISQIANDGCLASSVSFCSHAGTHLDAPAHMLSKGKKLDAFPAEKFVAKAIVLDVERASGDVQLSDIDLASLNGVEAVLFCTGWQKHYGSEKYYKKYPAISSDVADFLATSNLKMVGIDSPSVDSEENPSFPVHKKLLQREVLPIENLCNLDKLLGKTFTLIAMPQKVPLDGFPIRAVAMLD
jgi:kynurenine formamidase